MIVDYHMHLRDSQERIAHTADAVEPFIETAAEHGVDEIGFTEHVYYFRQTRPLWELPYQTERCIYDLDAYVDAVVEAKRRGLPVKLGLEIDYAGGRQDELDAILEPYPWDYLLGSVHWIDGLAVDSSPNAGVWAEWPVEEVWRRYFEALAECARAGLFDVLAHPDLVKVWGSGRPLPERDPRHYYEPAIEAIAESGIAVEVSTAGLRKPVGELYPARAFAEMCVEAGASFALSSDAHLPEQVGFGYERAVAFLDDLGVDEICVFEGRRRRLEPLGPPFVRED